MREICCWITPACTYQFGLMSFDLEVEGIIKLNIKVERIIKMIALKPGQLLAFIQFLMNLAFIVSFASV